MRYLFAALSVLLVVSCSSVPLASGTEPSEGVSARVIAESVLASEMRFPKEANPYYEPKGLFIQTHHFIVIQLSVYLKGRDSFKLEEASLKRADGSVAASYLRKSRFLMIWEQIDSKGDLSDSRRNAIDATYIHEGKFLIKATPKNYYFVLYSDKPIAKTGTVEIRYSTNTESSSLAIEM